MSVSMLKPGEPRRPATIQPLAKEPPRQGLFRRWWPVMLGGFLAGAAAAALVFWGAAALLKVW
jgi:hypothetical protein